MLSETRFMSGFMGRAEALGCAATNAGLPWADRDLQYTFDSTSVRGRVSGAGGKAGASANALDRHAAALRAKPTIAVTITDASRHICIKRAYLNPFELLKNGDWA